MTRRASAWQQQQPSNESSLWDCPDPNPNSVEIFRFSDALPESVRKLIHEYGFNIVVAMIEDGYEDADELEFKLMQWRYRRQEEWLATDYRPTWRDCGFPQPRGRV